MESVYIYKCANDACGEKDEPEYEIFFAEELVDDQNIADMFCPNCNSKLQRISFTAILA
jgi:DNA-directed RNA polymerase subunit RPC12/RpoP